MLCLFANAPEFTNRRYLNVTLGFDPRGYVFVRDAGDYVIRQLTLSGDTVRVFEFPYEPLRDPSDPKRTVRLQDPGCRDLSGRNTFTATLRFCLRS